MMTTEEDNLLFKIIWHLNVYFTIWCDSPAIFVFLYPEKDVKFLLNPREIFFSKKLFYAKIFLESILYEHL